MDADVIVVGAGNAGMSAAQAARERGASVLVLEKAPREWSGGNSAFTAGAMRVAHDGIASLRDVRRGRSAAGRDRPAAVQRRRSSRPTCGGSRSGAATTRWRACSRAIPRTRSGGCTRRGIRFRLMYERQSYEADGAAPFWGGLAVGVVDGGRGLIDQHAAAARGARDRGPPRRGRSRTLVDGGVVVGAGRDRRRCARAAVVLAAGGFESNPQMRAALPGAELGRGEGARHAAQHRRGAAARRCAAAPQPYGNWSGCHAIQWDRDAPPTGDLELTNRFSRQSYPVGIVVNVDGERFIDEGADFRNYTYAKYGAEVLKQPSGVAFQVFDARSVPLLRTIDYEAPGATRVDADSLARVGRRARDRRRALRADRARVQRRDRAGGVRPGGQGRRAHRRAGRAEVQLGAADRGAAVHRLPDHVRDHVHLRRRARRRATRACWTSPAAPLPGLYAAGELVGGLFFHNYPGGSGLTAGTVYGRRAGYAGRNYGIGATLSTALLPMSRRRGGP